MEKKLKNTQPLSCFLTKSSYKICSGNEDTLYPPHSSVKVSGNHYSSNPYQDFNSTGESYCILESPEYYRSKLHFLSHIVADGDNLQVNNHTISIKPNTDNGNSWRHVRKILYDLSHNICFILREISSHPFSEDVSLQVFILFPCDLNTAKIDFDLSTAIPQYRLHYTRRNLFKFELVSGGLFLAIFANGFKYGHKRYHIDYSAGYIIDLVPYETMEPVLRFFSDAQSIDLSSILQVKMFIDASASKLFCYVYSGFDDDFHSVALKHNISETDECVKIYHIHSDVRKESCFDYFDHCGGNTFVYVSQADSVVKIERLDNEAVHILREFSLKTDAVEQNQIFSAFSLFHQLNKLLLSMQGIDFKVRIMDLISGCQVLSISLDHPVKSIRLNWNMEEIACTRVDTQNYLYFDIYDIGKMDMSLKNLSRVMLLKSFSNNQLLKFPIPKNLKSYLNVI